MSESLDAAASAVLDVQAALATISKEAHDLSDACAIAAAAVAVARGKLARFQDDDSDEYEVSANAIGFAQNVAHALAGLDRVLANAVKASLEVGKTRKGFTEQVASWQAAVSAPADKVVRD